jgi:hypothetical protein
MGFAQVCAIIAAMTTFSIRPARESDAAFIAWVQQEAARSHLPIGFFDLAFPGPDAERLRIIERMVRARRGASATGRAS